MDKSVFTALRLQNFRSYSDFAVELSPGVNIVVGPNASGKTNLLEAMLVVCGNTSYRTTFANLIQNGSDWARIDADFENSHRVVKLAKLGETIERLYEINQKPFKRLSFSDKLPVIVFEPEHLRLLTGSPELRRDFFDNTLENSVIDFASINQKYRRVLAQRNHLLKSSHSNQKSQIFAWDIRLSELAGRIVKERTNLIKLVNEELSDIYSELAQRKTVVNVKYESQLDINNYETDLLKRLETGFETDVLRGFTSYGPHRDSIVFYMNKTSAESVASRGETRTLVIALKLLIMKLIETARQQKPLILLDDVFSELDGARRNALTDQLKNYQTIITTTDADIVGKHLSSSASITVLD